MKFIDALKLSFIKSHRNKKNIFLILIFMISVLILLSALTFKIIFFDNVEKIKKSAEYRTLIVTPKSDDIFEYGDNFDDYGYDRILNIKHVTALFDSRYDHIETQVPKYQTDNYNGTIQLQSGVGSILPEVIMGKSFNNNEKGVAICPMNFYPSVEDTTNLKNEFINGKDILNTEFEIEKPIYVYSDGIKDSGKKYHKRFKIIGLYNAEKIRNAPYECYVNPQDVKEIYDNTSAKRPGTLTVYGVYAYVDDINNVNEVIKEIKKLGFNVNIGSYFDEEYHNTIKLVCNLTVFITTIAIAALTFLYIRKQINNNSKSIATLKSVGYKNNDICLINVLEVIFLATISLIIGITIFEILLAFIKIKYKEFLMYNLVEINHFLLPYLITILIVIIIPIIVTIILSFMKNKINIIDMIKGK